MFSDLPSKKELWSEFSTLYNLSHVQHRPSAGPSAYNDTEPYLESMGELSQFYSKSSTQQLLIHVDQVKDGNLG